MSILPAPVTRIDVLVIQTYTVDFNRDGSPRLGHIVGRLKSNGSRFLANQGDEETLRQLASSTREPIGRSGRVRVDKEGPEGHNLFTLDGGANL